MENKKRINPSTSEPESLVVSNKENRDTIGCPSNSGTSAPVSSEQEKER